MWLFPLSEYLQERNLVDHAFLPPILAREVPLTLSPRNFMVWSHTGRFALKALSRQVCVRVSSCSECEEPTPVPRQAACQGEHCYGNWFSSDSAIGWAEFLTTH